ncbi:MAG: transglycosylase domain-containing protein [Christensenellales bacterium]
MKFKKAIKIFLMISLILIIIFLSFTLWFIINSINEVKSTNVSLTGNAINSCEIYDKNGDVILNNLGLENSYVELKDINSDTINAFLSIEDKTFYEHDGLNYKRMLKAMFVNIIDGSYSQGASTITQQLVKNKYLSNEKTLSRKVKEIYLTKKMEATEEKDKILENYLNTIYYGNGAYGIGNASYRFFGKTPKELTLSESCVLAGAVNYPSYYSPINNLEKSKNRRDLVLSEMLSDGKITNQEYLDALNEEIVLNPKPITTINKLDLYSQNVLNEASKILNISEEEIFNKNYKIFTYQDNEIQNTLNNKINDEKYYDENEYGNIADSLSIILDNQTGGVVAVAGKSDYNLVNFKRQPGSLVKPVLIYTPALEEKIIYPCSEILDEKVNFDLYTPQNVGDKYYGYVSINECVAKSLNIPAIKLCQELGIETCKSYGEKCGLDFNENDNGLAIALGGLTDGFTLQNITESYLPFTNNGKFKKSSYISKIISPNNLTIYNNKLSENTYCSSDNAYLMTNILNYSTRFGTSKKLSSCNYDIAGKTGTVNVKNSNKNTDAYSLAYTSKHTMSVWLGNYSMNGKFNLNGNNNGGTFATEIIKNTFDKIYEDNKPADFNVPNSIISLPVDTINLKENHKIFLGENLPERYQKLEIFSQDNTPTNSKNNLLNTDDINFTITNKDNYIKLTFNCKEYFDYYIYRIDSSNNKKLLKTISNQNGIYEFNDYNINFNEEFKYYLVCKSIINNFTQQTEIKKTKIIKDYNNLLNNTDNLSWLFGN